MYSQYRYYLENLGDVAGWIIALVALVFIVAIAVGIMYLLTLQNTIKEVSVQNRRIRPGQVWLLLIPVFSTFYLYNVVKSISESLEAEYRSRGVNAEARPTFQVGNIYFILGVISFFIGIINSFGSVLPSFISSLLSLGGFVTWIIYWAQVAQNKKRLQSIPALQEGSSQIFTD